MEKFTLHGANPYKQYEQFGINQPKQVIDFSANVNVLEYPKKIEVDYETLVIDYPDPDCKELKRFIAKNENILEEEVIFTNGSNEAIYIISSYYTNKRVGILHPTYSEYEKSLLSYDVKVIPVTSFDEALNSNLDALFICSPNNPTGTFYSDEEIIPFIKECKEVNIDLIIDQAYIDFSMETNNLSLLTTFDNLYILRSITKIFPLAGIRIGYVIANQSKINLISKRLPTWSVNAVAQALALGYLKDQAYITRTKEYYHNERIRVMSKLEEIGYELYPSSVNFYLIRVEDDLLIIKYLLERGIVVRHTRNHLTLDGKYIRVAIRSVHDNDKLIEALTEFKKTKL